MSPQDRLMKARGQMGHSTAERLFFTKDDLVYLATKGDTIAIRNSAAEALYALGARDGARELSAARNAATVVP